jgi:hypothetical protein
MIPLVADAGYTNLILAGSRRNKLMKKVGIIVFWLKKLIPLAENTM